MFKSLSPIEIALIKKISGTGETGGGDAGTGGSGGETEIPTEITYYLGEISDFEYTTLGSNIYLKKYIGTKANLEIPSTLELDGTTYPVYLWSLSFAENDVIEHIKIDIGVKSHAGAGIVVYNSGNYPDNLKTVVGLDTVEGCTSYPSFQNCALLEDVPAIPQGVTNNIGNYPFWYCNALKDVSELIVPDGVTSMRNWFAHCANIEKGCIVPEHVTDIGLLFYDCPKIAWFRVESKTATIQWMNAVQVCSNLLGECEMECYSGSTAFAELKANTHLQSYATNDGQYLYPKAIGNDVLNVSCFGDSLTAGQNVTPTYPTVLDGLLPEKSIVYNYGYGGSTMEDIRDRMAKHPKRLIDDIVVIWAGTNGSDATASIETRLTCTDEMVAMLQTEKYIVMTPVYHAYSAEIDTAYAEKYGDHYFSLREWFDNGGYTIADYITDGTHFNADGLSLVAQAVYEKMVALGYVTVEQ